MRAWTALLALAPLALAASGTAEARRPAPSTPRTMVVNYCWGYAPGTVDYGLCPAVLLTFRSDGTVEALGEVGWYEERRGGRELDFGFPGVAPQPEYYSDRVGSGCYEGEMIVTAGDSAGLTGSFMGCFD